MTIHAAIKSIAIFACGLLLSGGYSSAQQVIFKNMFPNEDLRWVTNITQDPKGAMWFISGSGLVNYDGYTSTYYKHDPKNPNSLAGLRVECVYADKKGIIWVGFIGAGLDSFDPENGSFTHYRHNPKDSTTLAHDMVTDLFEDKQGNFWVGTHGGLDKMDKQTGRFTHFVHAGNDATTISNNQVRTIYQDREGTLWIGTGSAWLGSDANTFPGEPGIQGEGGLNKMDTRTGKFTRYLSDPNNPNTLINNKVRAIFEDNDGHFWVGTAGDGLHLMDRKTGSFQRLTYDPAHPEKLSRPPVSKDQLYDHITFITQDVSGAIWIGTLYGGLTRYDEKTRVINHYIGKDTASGFNGAREQTFGHYISRDGILWLTCLAGNIYTLSPNAVKIPYLREGTYASTFYLDKDSDLYIGSGSGLIKKNLKDGTARKMPVKGFIGRLEKDNSGNLWIATAGSGLYKLDLQTEILTQYRHTNETNSLANDTMIAVYVDKDHKVWTGTASGLDKLDPATGVLQHFIHNPHDSSSINSMEILAVTGDRSKNIWIGHSDGGGVDKMNPQTGKCKNYLAGEIAVISVIESNDGTMWIGTTNGLYKYVEQADNCVLVTNPLTGKSFPLILSIKEDQQENLWLISGTGLIKFNPKNREISEFGKEAGVDAGALTPFSLYQDNSGRLYFGDTLGYYCFHPKDIETIRKPPEIVFTAFSLGSEVVKPGVNSPIQDEIWHEKAIELNYNQNVFSFEYNPVDYNNPQQNKSLYKLENYDDDWRIGTNPAKAYYFNVPPGKYTFHVKARNSLGLWTEKSIAVTITPPWWRTWWAYTIYGICFVVLSFFANRFIRNRIIEKEKAKTREKELAQAREIERAYTELKQTQAQLIQSEKMASLGELTAGIAHEIQNPLNFVNNFSEVNRELLVELKDEMSKGNNDNAIAIADNVIENSDKINHHGKRADSIVKGMLQHSRSSSSVKEPTDINALADEYLRLSYHGLRAKDKEFNATIKTDFDGRIGNINIIPPDIGRVLLNLYNNAFYAVNEMRKTTNGKYDPVVSLSTNKNDRSVMIRVTDNGNGIPQKNLDKIFQPFFTTKPTGQGTGLGLSLAYDIVKAHGGELKVKTKEGEGSEFIIQLPVV